MPTSDAVLGIGSEHAAELGNDPRRPESLDLGSRYNRRSGAVGLLRGPLGDAEMAAGLGGDLR